MQLILKTVPGLEDLLINEAISVGKSTFNRIINKGVVFAHVNDERLMAFIDQSRFLTSASLLTSYNQFEGDLNSIIEIAREVEWEKYISSPSKIAIRTERVGRHDFTSIDVNKAIGEVVVKKLRDSNHEISVHLNSPNYVITIDVINNEIFMGIRLAGEESLHRKWYRVYEHIASLKPTIANALLELGDFKDKEKILDPVCGGGTIIIEAALYHEDIVGICNDLSRKAIYGAKLNALVAGVLKRIKFMNFDVYDLSNHIESKTIDLLVADPPFGIRLGNLDVSRKVVRGIFHVASRILSNNGRVSIIYPDKDFIESTALSYGLEIKHAREIMHGDLKAWIIILNR